MDFTDDNFNAILISNLKCEEVKVVPFIYSKTIGVDKISFSFKNRHKNKYYLLDNKLKRRK